MNYKIELTTDKDKIFRTYWHGGFIYIWVKQASGEWQESSQGSPNYVFESYNVKCFRELPKENFVHYQGYSLFIHTKRVHTHISHKHTYHTNIHTTWCFRISVWSPDLHLRTFFYYIFYKHLLWFLNVLGKKTV